jgi:hypothetical protein
MVLQLAKINRMQLQSFYQSHVIDRDTPAAARRAQTGALERMASSRSVVNHEVDLNETLVVFD